MAKKLTSLGKRILPLMLAVMLIASAMFVPTVVSADTETDPWEQTGLHKTTVIDFNGSTNIADYTAAGTTPVLNAYSSIKDGALYMKNILTSSDFKVRFDAYGDIETLSMDIKTDEYSAAGGIPGIIFYDQIYTDKNGNSVASVSTLGFSVRADGRWRARSMGLCGDGVVRDASEEKVWDWSSAYYTLTLTYGTEYINNSDNGTNIRYDKLGNELKCKFLTNVTVTDVNGTNVYDWKIDTNQADYTSSHTTYGVNKILTDAEDNENVMIGFGPQYENAYLGMYVDNIKVTYRENANKVMALIDEIGTVEATEACLAKIIKAETAYGLLTDVEKAKVTNYETLTAARTQYDDMLENADVYAVEELIAKIGEVDATEECLAKIVAAENAFAELTAEKQELVSNYAVLKKARADYNAAKYGLHAQTSIDFSNGKLDGITSDFATAEIPENEEYLHIANWGVGKKIRFDAYGDIETFSFDMKVDSSSGTVVTPDIVFYDQVYYDRNGNLISNAHSTIHFARNADYATNQWRLRMMGLTNGYHDETGKMVYLPNDGDWSQTWLTVKMTYGTTYYDMSLERDDRKDRLGNEIYAKILTNISLTVVGESEPFWSYDISTGQVYYSAQRATYGVNKLITDAEDSENVTLGFNSMANSTGISVDNIKVTYRENVAKVEAFIAAIGTVEATDTCLAKIVEAETVYGLLSAEEKAEVSNYETLTTARATYNNLVENADVVAVEALITAIGVVENSEACLAKIVAAEEAYAALSPEKQALVSNYAVLTKARADYNAAKYGIHKDTVIDFNGSTDIADYTSVAPTLSASTKIEDGRLYLAGTNNIRFDAYGDIETLSMDIQMKAESNSANCGNIVFFDEIYSYIDGEGNPQTKTATSTLTFQKNANGWFFKPTGLCDSHRDVTEYYTGGWQDKTLTVKLTYGTTYVNMDNTNASYVRKDKDGVVLYCKYVTKVELINSANTTVHTWKVTDANSHNLVAARTTYGVNRNLTEADDNEKVTIGFSGALGNPMYVDNIKVTYRENVAKVEAFIAAIGTVEATDTCLAKIVEAETAYGLLSDAEKAVVSNYETLTTARATYNNLVENADVYAVETLIAAIGVVENSEACLEKIVAAEEAYAALDAGKQALVSNYAVLEKARADYNAAKYGIHNDTVIDFNGSTNIADYTAVGTTPTLNAYSKITNGELLLQNITTDNNVNIRFDAYGDIETLSMDIKTDGYSSDSTLPGIVFYDEIYTDKEGNSVAATSKMSFSYSASTGLWRARTVGLCGDGLVRDHIATKAWDWSSGYYTLTLTYGTTYVDNSDNGTNIRYDKLGKELACKFLTHITVTDANGDEVFYWEITTNQSDYESSHATYGVNKTLTDAEDNENVMIGFGGSFVTSYIKTYIDNIKVTYRNDKATGLVASAKDIAVVDNSAALAQKVALMEEIYNILPANQQDSEAKAAIDALKAKIAIAAAAEAPTVDGATIRTTTATSDQNLRFKTTMPTTAIDGYDIVEFGTVMFPAQYLGENELTFDSSYKLSNGNIATVLAAKANTADYEELPTAFEAELYGIDFNESKNACGIRISARSYVKYSDGETTFIIYSKNDKQPNTEATEGVKNGTCTRSVFSVARTIATALLDTATYPTETFGEIVGSIDLATNTNSEILGFVYNNLARVRKIAEVR